MLPEHILAGRNFNTVWNSCICDPKTKKPISSGPMLVQSFTPDQQVTLVPNKNYWGKQATVPKVVFIPVRDSNSEVNAFRAGEVDMIYPQNQIGLRKRIESVDGAKYTSSLGPQWEHFDMLSTVPGLDDLQVRKAIATAMPRQQIVDRVVKDANDKAAGAEQHAVHGEPAAVRRRTGIVSSGRGCRRRQRDPRRRRLDARERRHPSEGQREARVHRRHDVGQPGTHAGRADHAAAVRRRSA